VFDGNAPGASAGGLLAVRQAMATSQRAKRSGRTTVAAKSDGSRLSIPDDAENLEFAAGNRTVRLTNLKKPFWPREGITKGDLLRYYLAISDVLLPHIRGRAMVMKRYPNGAHGKCFFMKRAPSPRPDWIRTCSIEHASGNVIDFPMIQDLPSLLWVINLGCIDLNQWYARCDDVHRPDYLHFDLDPVPPAGFDRVRDAALALREALDALELPGYAKTTGSRGMHICVPIRRGPLQKDVWTFAKELAKTLEARHPQLLTAEYRIAKRPRGRVLVDYNQNAWGRTLASVYSPRPRDGATVSTPVRWSEVERGITIDDFHLRNVPARVRKLGDLWEPLLARSGRARLEQFM
jgi:bifunctional non-homologous end joining protein LigD